MRTDELARLILGRAAGGARVFVALAGAPGAGKSTLAAALATAIGPTACVVPMDGFHYDDAVLTARGLRHRKGAPETFDVGGFAHLLARLRTGDEVAIPVFDRSLELSRAGAFIVGPAHRILIIEGNYLLLDQPHWRDLRPLFDLTIRIDVPLPVLEARLRDRWATYGKTEAEARAWIDGNDLPNIMTVLTGSAAADITLRAD